MGIRRRRNTKKFIEDSTISNKYDFSFIPVGFNLGFEHKFLLEKSAKYDLFPISILSIPCVDLHAIAILMNKGEFKGSGLDQLIGKTHSGHPVVAWYSLGKQFLNILSTISTQNIWIMVFISDNHVKPNHRTNSIIWK